MASNQRRKEKRAIERAKNRALADGLGGLPSGYIAGSMTISQQASFSGPIPPPALLKQYDEIAPGTADSIVKLWQEQTRHRMSLEKTVIEGDTKRSWWGLGIGGALSAACIGAGSWLVALGHDGAGATIATGAVVSLATVFVYGTAARRAERRDKAALQRKK